MGDSISVKRLETGWYLIRGNGPCEWAQVPEWPCNQETLREHAFPEASETFLRQVIDRWRLDMGKADKVKER